MLLCVDLLKLPRSTKKSNIFFQNIFLTYKKTDNIMQYFIMLSVFMHSTGFEPAAFRSGAERSIP